MDEMSPRERVFRVLKHQPADRMPLTLDVGASAGIDSTYLGRFRCHTGSDDPPEYFGYDIRYIAAPVTPATNDFAAYHDELPSGTIFDEFGVAHIPVEHFPLGHSVGPWRKFTDPKQVWDYPFPTFHVDDRFVAQVRRLQDRGYVVSAASGSINEWCYYLRGMEEFMTDLVDHHELAEAILTRVASLTQTMAAQLADVGIDILCFYGDVGGQNGLLMGPRMWQRWIKPRWRQIIQTMRWHKPDAFAFYHSCGYIEPLIPELAEVGFDILNPVQPESMDPIEIKRKHGERIALWGGIGMQSTMLSSTPIVVRRETRRVADAWVQGSGAIVTAAQTMLPDVPWENIVALVEEVKATQYL